MFAHAVEGITADGVYWVQFGELVPFRMGITTDSISKHQNRLIVIGASYFGIALWDTISGKEPGENSVMEMIRLVAMSLYL